MQTSAMRRHPTENAIDVATLMGGGAFAVLEFWRA
jgi:hypothetical protein